MTKSPRPPGQAGELAAPDVTKSKGIPIIWIIPAVAIAVGGWLWYRALQEQGPQITIQFDSADGLEAGKTKIKFKELEVGHVTTITLDKDLEHVSVSADMVAGSEPYMLDKTRFWVVRPRIGKGGISGLGTIVSGPYINMDISAEGKPTKSFVGLEEPPVLSGSEEGLSIVLHADALGSISNGTSVYYMQVEVGQVEGYQMLQDQQLLEFQVFIEQKYAGLVRENTHFWNASGVNVSLSAQGFEVQTESVESLLMGGIAFGVPEDQERGQPAANGAVFELFRSKEAAEQLTDVRRHTMLYFNEPVDGLKPGATVGFRGIDVGRVLSVRIEYDQKSFSFLTPVLVETYPERLQRMGPAVEETDAERIKRLAAAGMRARLGTPNLITGARSIEVVFDRENPPVYRGPPDAEYPELPTVPSTGEALQQALADLPGIVTSAKQTLEGLDKLVNSPDTTAILASVRASSDSLQGVLADLDGRSAPLIDSVEGTLTDLRTLLADVNTLVADVQAAAPGILASVDETSRAATAAAVSGEKSLESLRAGLPELQRRLDSTLEQLAEALRSFRALANTLELQPESLIKGKRD